MHVQSRKSIQRGKRLNRSQSGFQAGGARARRSSQSNQTSDRTTQRRGEEPMTQAQQTTNEFIEDDADEESAVRQAPSFASEPPAGEMSFPESTPPPAERETAVSADVSGDSTLSRYFREMATHQVMGPDEELQAAQRVEETE